MCASAAAIGALVKPEYVKGTFSLPGDLPQSYLFQVSGSFVLFVGTV